ncbi:hypothetical protein F5Y09DRAFT_143114 [Xylaria sp. FL1042]|nr:hypothetical protein F5Y09DRAFT_143114 [Xylaria sp. FL1042]
MLCYTQVGVGLSFLPGLFAQMLFQIEAHSRYVEGALARLSNIRKAGFGCTKHATSPYIPNIVTCVLPFHCCTCNSFLFYALTIPFENPRALSQPNFVYFTT